MKMKPSQILLICGLVVLLAGCILSICKIEPHANYVLVAGALLIIFRGGLRARERNENDDDNENDNDDENETNKKE